jgi:diguanylate cyclase (GGDEF)-like protein
MMSDQKLLPLSVLDHLKDAAVIADADGKVLGISPAFQTLCGLSGPDIAARAEGAAAKLHDTLRTAFRSGGLWNGSLPLADGSYRQMELMINPVRNAKGAVTHHIAVASQTPGPEARGTGLRLGRCKITGLPDRSVFADRVEHAMHAHKRQGGSVVLMMLGLDHFTLVNDGFGSEVGDRMLGLVAERLRKCIRDTDSAIRLDGDKFAILMTVTQPNDVITVADKVMAASADPYLLGDQEIILTFSIGIASYPEDAQSMPQLIQCAENSLHHAKASGRNQYQFFSKDMTGRALSRLGLATRIRRAINNDEFLVYYQPKVRSDDHSIVGAEALARWKDPEHGLIMPADFIPVAEETGLIEEIGLRILELACHQTRKWQMAQYDPITIGVNISPRQFRNSHLLDNIKRILAESQLDPNWLELELTESMIIHNPDSAAEKMRALRDMGISIAIDDFGTGYSSLSYLGKFPVSSLKIDRAFVTDVNTNPKTAEVARAIIGLSKGLKLNVTAEGCEIPEHLNFLKDNGCDTIQGFYFSKPVPAQEFEAMLRAGVVYAVPSFEDDLV